MNSTFAVVLVAIMTPIAAYLVAVRQFSGKVQSSDAKELWNESRAIRDWSQKQILTLSDDVRQLQGKVTDLTSTIVSLREELARAYQRIHELEKEVNGKNGTH